MRPNESEQTTARLAVVALLETPRVGQVFASARWPLHLTVVPNFESAHASRTRRALREVIAAIPRFDVSATSDSLLGPHGNIPVTLVERDPRLMKCHNELVSMLEDERAMFENPGYVGAGYVPHVTMQHNARLRAGEIVTVRDLALVDLCPDGVPAHRRIVDVAPLAKVRRRRWFGRMLESMKR